MPFTHDFGMAVPLVHRAVGREEVVVGTPVHVPDAGAGPAGEDHGEGRVVVRAVPVLQVHETPGGGGESVRVGGEDGLGGGGAGGGGSGAAPPGETAAGRQHDIVAWSDRRVKVTQL